MSKKGFNFNIINNIFFIYYINIDAGQPICWQRFSSTKLRFTQAPFIIEYVLKYILVVFKVGNNNMPVA